MGNNDILVGIISSVFWTLDLDKIKPNSKACTSDAAERRCPGSVFATENVSRAPYSISMFALSMIAPNATRKNRCHTHKFQHSKSYNSESCKASVYILIFKLPNSRPSQPIATDNQSGAVKFGIYAARNGKVLIDQRFVYQQDDDTQDTEVAQT